MESTLEPVVAAVLPVFGLVACGYLAGRMGLVTQASSVALNQFVYAFALPAMLFIAVYRGSLDEILSGSFLAAVTLATLGTALVGFALSYFVYGAPLFVSQLSIRAGAAASWQSVLLKLVLHPILTAGLAYHVLSVDPFWAKIAVVCASLPLGATAFVLAQRYRLLEAETSTGAVISTAASVLTVSLVMALLAAR